MRFSFPPFSNPANLSGPVSDYSSHYFVLLSARPQMPTNFGLQPHKSIQSSPPKASTIVLSSPTKTWLKATPLDFQHSPIPTHPFSSPCLPPLLSPPRVGERGGEEGRRDTILSWGGEANVVSEQPKKKGGRKTPEVVVGGS